MNNIFLKKTAVIVGVLYVMILALSSCQQTSTTVTDKFGDSLEINTIVKNNIVKDDSTTNYSYLLPLGYDGKAELPVIFFFDPHGDGNLPLNNYSELANKYGYIFIGINNVRNGQQISYVNRVFTSILQEIKSRFNIDENRIFTAGFSGGAKLAIIFAQQIPDIVGVAACGATLSMTSNTKPNYYYAGLVGNRDFNFLEVQQTLVIYENLGFDFTSAIFDGGHQWAPSNSFEMALIGFDIYSIKTKTTPKDKKLLAAVWDKMNDSISVFNQREDIINENIYINQTVRWFYGLKNTKELEKRSYAIIHSKPFFDLIKKHQKLIKKEVKLRTEFIKSYKTRDIDWWTTEVEHINKSINNKDKDIVEVSSRLKNYLSMVSFMLVKTDLNAKKCDKEVLKKLEIYKLVDPENSDVYLMYSYYYMLLQDEDNMIKSFKKAEDIGFDEYDVYKRDPFWAELFNREVIAELFKKS
jgi:dienelactone hydrolase